MLRIPPCAAFWFAIAIAGVLAPAAAAQEPGAAAVPPPAAEEAVWEFSGTVLYSDPPGSDGHLIPIIYADRGPLHLELRHNYEDLDTTSIFAGWTFAGGETVEYAVTPLLGAVAGDTDGVAPGVEFDVGWRRLAWYTEAEYLFDSHDRDDDFFYSWSTLTYEFSDRLSAGIVTERTKLVDTDYEYQRGLALSFSLAGLGFSLYAYNFTSDDFYAVFAVDLIP